MSKFASILQMCMSKSDYSIRRQMQDDVIEAYKQACQGCWTMDEAYKKAAKMPAPRYYVTPKQAYQVVSRMMRGDFNRVDHMKPNRRRMYYSLFHLVNKMCEQRVFCDKSLYYIMQYAVTRPAPEFFCSYITFGWIRRLVKQGEVDDEGRMVHRCKNRPTYRHKRKEVVEV